MVFVALKQNWHMESTGSHILLQLPLVTWCEDCSGELEMYSAIFPIATKASTVSIGQPYVLLICRMQELG